MDDEVAIGKDDPREGALMMYLLYSYLILSVCKHIFYVGTCRDMNVFFFPGFFLTCNKASLG
jgi:hypothetical protein